MNYSIPVNKPILTDKEIEYAKEELDNLLLQTIMISQLSSGISYQDVEEMDEYERTFIFKKLIQMKKEENEIKRKAFEESRNKR